MAYYRVQLLLTHEQHRKLKQLARLRQTSISALVREFVEKGLQEAAREETDWIERTRQVTQALLEARGGKPIEIDPVQLLRAIREERGHALAPWTADRRLYRRAREAGAEFVHLFPLGEERG